MTGRIVLWLLLGLLATASHASGGDTATARAGAGEAPERVGRRIYRTGLLPSGEPLRATVQDDIALTGSQAACASCHGRSGLGYTEGDRVPLAITGPALFRPRLIGRKELYASRAEGPGTRPAYTLETAARAIRDGLGPDGRELDPLMPRYTIADRDLGPLLAYLETLGATRAPGVTREVIHVGTAVAGQVDPEQRAAMLEVLEAFFRNTNAQTRRETLRARVRMLHKEWHYRAYRRWRLHVWQLDGPRNSWKAQLERRYAERPVFALVSGLAAGDWEPLHAFCEAHEVPCLFPNTNLPVSSREDFYSIYFSEGVGLEAKVLARHLQQQGRGRRVLQVYREGEAGSVASRSLRGALPAGVVVDLATEPAGPVDVARLRHLLRPGDDLVLWAGDRDLEAVAAALEGLQDRPSAIYLSSSLTEDCIRRVPPSLQECSYCIRPFSLPEQMDRQLRPARAWLRANGITAREERIQLDTLFAVRTLGEALEHVVGNFSREYLVEKIEHRLSSSITPSRYPHIGLASGQRFASKGAYVVRPSGGSGGGMEPVTDWIVPGP